MCCWSSLENKNKTGTKISTKYEISTTKYVIICVLLKTTHIKSSLSHWMKGNNRKVSVPGYKLGVPSRLSNTF